MRKLLLGTAALAAITASVVTWATPCEADPVFELGSTFTVQGNDFPTNFTGATATLGTPTTINAGQLQLSETFTPVSASQEWVVFDFATASGGPIIGNGTANFSMAISGVATTAPAVLSNPFAYFTSNGTPFGPLTPGSGFGVEANPITGTGQVLDFVGFSPGAPSSTFSLNIFSDPASFLATVGVDPTTANDFHFGALLTLPVPEPASLGILASGVVGLGAMRRRRNRRLH
jgi:hypothetical protein